MNIHLLLIPVDICIACSIFVFLGTMRIFGSNSQDPTSMLLFVLFDLVKSVGFTAYIVNSMTMAMWVGSYIILNLFVVGFARKKYISRKKGCVTFPT